MTDSKQELRDHVRYLADELGKGSDAEWASEWRADHEDEDPSGYDYLENVLEIEYVVSADGTYRGARVLVTVGGPNIWIDTQRRTVDGYWGSDEAHASFDDELGLDDTLREFWESTQEKGSR